MTDPERHEQRKKTTIDRLIMGSFDAEGLQELSSAEIAELLSRTQIMRIPEIRLGLQQLVQVRQSEELAARLQTGMATLDRAITESVTALKRTVEASDAGARELNTTMLRLNRWVLRLSVIMALAALLQIGQWIEGSLARPHALSSANPVPTRP